MLLSAGGGAKFEFPPSVNIIRPKNFESEIQMAKVSKEKMVFGVWVFRNFRLNAYLAHSSGCKISVALYTIKPHFSNACVNRYELKRE